MVVVAQVFPDVVLALAFPESHDGDLLLSGKSLHLAHERLADGVHQHAGGKPVSAMKPKKARYAAFPLQPQDVDVQVHPVNALDLQRHMLPPRRTSVRGTQRGARRV